MPPATLVQTGTVATPRTHNNAPGETRRSGAGYPPLTGGMSARTSPSRKACDAKA